MISDTTVAGDSQNTFAGRVGRSIFSSGPAAWWPCRLGRFGVGERRTTPLGQGCLFRFPALTTSLWCSGGASGHCCTPSAPALTKAQFGYSSECSTSFQAMDAVLGPGSNRFGGGEIRLQNLRIVPALDPLRPLQKWLTRNNPRWYAVFHDPDGIDLPHHDHLIYSIIPHSKRYKTVPCVGQLTAATLVVYLPELGRWDGRALTSLVGLAPWARDSGQKRGNRSIRGGRGTVRRALYICAWVVLRLDGDLRDFYRRLRWSCCLTGICYRNCLGL